MKTKTYDIETHTDISGIDCRCVQEPAVYGKYSSLGAAEIDLRYQLKHEIMYKTQDVPEYEIKLNFIHV